MFKAATKQGTLLGSSPPSLPSENVERLSDVEIGDSQASPGDGSVPASPQLPPLVESEGGQPEIEPRGLKRSRVAAHLPTDPLQSEEGVHPFHRRGPSPVAGSASGPVVAAAQAAPPGSVPGVSGPVLVTPSVPFSQGPPDVPAVTSSSLLVLRAKDEQIRAFMDFSLGRRAAPASTNQNLFHAFKSLTDLDLKFKPPPQVMTAIGGHCMYLVTRTAGKHGVVNEKVKLLEGGTNKDHPRTNLLEGLGDSKIYIYHILLRYRILTEPTRTATLERLRAVSQNKKDETPLTIVHQCGHKWCLNYKHIDIQTKIFNDQQTACHRGLQSANDFEQYSAVRKNFCHHKQRCWTLVYSKEGFRDDHDWAMH